MLLLAGCHANVSAKNGVMDLRAADLRSAPLQLFGDWDFYWERAANGRPDASVLPGHWRGLQLTDGRKLPGFGWATYRLKVLLPDAAKSGATPLAISIEPVDTACRISITDVSGHPLITPMGAGVVGADEKTHRSSYTHLHATFVAREDFYITIEVSNFSLRTGGIFSLPLLADADVILKEVQRNRDTQFLIFGVLLLMALHHLGIFVLYRSERGPLYLFVFTFLIAIRTLVTARFISEQHAREWWATLDRIEYLTFYLATPTFALFMRNAFPRDFSPRVIRGYVILCLAFAASVLLTPVWVYSETLPYFQKITLGIIVWVLAMLVRAARRGSDRLPWLVLASFVVLAVTVVNDILHSTFHTPYVVHYGLTFFLVVQSLLIAVNNQRARRHAELTARNLAVQTREMTVLNEELQRQIGERSHRLSQMLATLASGLPQKHALVPGTVMAQRYRIEQMLGEGGMGAVYAAVRLKDEKPVALKVIRTGGNANVLARFAREAEAASTVHHPNVVAILDIDVGDHGELFIVMERVQGSTLDHERKRFGDSGWALPVLGQLAEALAAIHRSGVVHRDLKPQNILVNADGVIKVADFGIAALRRQDHADSSPDHGVALPRLDDSVTSSPPDDSVATPRPRPAATLTDELPTRGERPSQLIQRSSGSALTRTGTVMGSPLYMAPETWRGSKFASSQADMFSFGIIAYEILSGTRPFEAPFDNGQAYRQPPALAVRCPTVPTGVSTLIDACLLADPAGRPTADALIEALDRHRAAQ